MTGTVPPRKQRGGCYTDEVVEEALVLYAEHGPTEASRRLGPDGPSKGRISTWARQAGVVCNRDERTEAATRAAAANWRLARAQHANEMGVVSQEALAKSREAVKGGHANDARQYMLVSAIAVDKADQLAGIAAEPVVHHHLITLAEVEAEIARLGGDAIDVDSWDSDERRSIGDGDGE